MQNYISLRTECFSFFVYVIIKEKATCIFYIFFKHPNIKIANDFLQLHLFSPYGGFMEI